MELTIFRILVAMAGVFWAIHIDNRYYAFCVGLACCIFSHYCGFSDGAKTDDKE